MIDMISRLDDEITAPVRSARSEALVQGIETAAFEAPQVVSLPDMRHHLQHVTAALTCQTLPTRLAA